MKRILLATLVSSAFLAGCGGGGGGDDGPRSVSCTANGNTVNCVEGNGTPTSTPSAGAPASSVPNTGAAQGTGSATGGTSVTANGTASAPPQPQSTNVSTSPTPAAPPNVTVIVNAEADAIIAPITPPPVNEDTATAPPPNQPAPPVTHPNNNGFTAELINAPGAGVYICGVARLEIRGTNIRNAELIRSATGYEPRVGTFAVAPGGDSALLIFDPRSIQNNGYHTFRILAWDQPAGTPVANEVEVMPARQWVFANNTYPCISPGSSSAGQTGGFERDTRTPPPGMPASSSSSSTSPGTGTGGSSGTPTGTTPTTSTTTQ